MSARMSRFAGAWYPAAPEQLARDLHSLLELAPPLGLTETAAILVPHAGYTFSGATAARAYRELTGRTCTRIIVIGPAHRIAMQDTALVVPGDQFRTPLGTLPADPDAVDQLSRSRGFHRADPATFGGEHSVEMQFPFLQTVLPGCPVTALVTGRLSAGAISRLATSLRPLLSPCTVLVVSSDFTHYGAAFGYTPFQRDIEQRLRALDLGAFAHIEQKDPAGLTSYLDKTGATICGADAIGILLDLLGEHQAVQRLDYRTSGHATGDWSHCVSYVAAAVTGDWDGKESQP